MNYLAHFHLVSPDPELVVGALLGDFVKGPLKGEFAPGVEKGIWLHRRIDALVDADECVSDFVAAMPSAYRRYGGIMLDMCFDHCLATRWSQFSDQPLSGFVADIERELLAAHDTMPAKAQQQAYRLIQHRLLSSLVHWTMVEKILAGIGTRLMRANPLAESGDWLNRQMVVIDDVFQQFYPRLQQEVSKQLCE